MRPTARPSISSARSSTRRLWATGAQTAEAEEPGGAALREKKTQEEDEGPPAVQQECPATFGNSDIIGGSYLNRVTEPSLIGE